MASNLQDNLVLSTELLMWIKAIVNWFDVLSISPLSEWIEMIGKKFTITFIINKKLYLINFLIQYETTQSSNLPDTLLLLNKLSYYQLPLLGLKFICEAFKFTCATATWIWWKNKEIVDVQNPKLEEKKNQHKTMQVVIASAVSINVGIAW